MNTYGLALLLALTVAIRVWVTETANSPKKETVKVVINGVSYRCTGAGTL